jgi:hypothetical protein
VIELGCGPGHFLWRARAAGVAAMGFDINGEAVRRSRAEGLSAFNGGLAEALAASRDLGPGAVALAAFHFIEHAEDLELLGAGLSALAGEAHLSFPNPARWTRHLLPSWMVGRREMWDYPPWHQSRWNRDALAAFARVSGSSWPLTPKSRCAWARSCRPAPTRRDSARPSAWPASRGDWPSWRRAGRASAGGLVTRGSSRIARAGGRLLDEGRGRF